MGKGLLNSGQAAKAAGISLMTLQRWIAAGKLTAPPLNIRNGRAVRLWNRNALDRLKRAKALHYGQGKGRRKKTKP